ncbi:bacillithiol system redox-active protein YtxJ [Polaribacter glomeratus]|uniref:Cytosolic protein n=1 Tax=Polaribacter glomeratus TaxID=102 RepID=A0A2S7WVS5_9FLAO|nr:bacillithiol system redox-active protein YtxJ [Polaribacter glomeratus]PQJ81685.1 cytosolic protein [Polaribacter glomeratus]TXD66390.1 bacillithiol system redox-active protein YtxJ [Polaribacter glomeratus]
MGIFNSMFGTKGEKDSKPEKKSYLNWIPLTSLEQLSEIKEQSKTESICIFKHSTRCGISSMVIKRFENLFTEEHQHLKVYYLDLLNYRNISDEIGYTFQVMHQSPQLLVIKNEVSVFDASHNDITNVNLKEFI